MAALNWERALVKVHVLQVDRKPENIAELDDGIAAGRTVDDWQMPKGAKPGDLVIWYAAGRQKYVARGWVDAIPVEVRKVPGPIVARLPAWKGSNRRTAGR